ncbi:hypothetical protein BJX76DRAFT_350982 [Aspergillus varians]
MKTTGILSLYLLGSIPRAIAVLVEITEIRRLNGSEPRVEIVDLPYIDDTVLPKDQPCSALPFLIREARLLTEELTVPTKCWMYTEQCRRSISPITNDDPYVYMSSASAFAARCYEDE